MTVTVAECNHPSVVLQQEIQHRPLEVGVRRPGAQIGEAGAGRGQESRKDFVFGGQPAKRLQGQGYPAVIRNKNVAGKTVHEVRVNQLATRSDAQAVLDRIASVEGVNGRVALSA